VERAAPDRGMTRGGVMAVEAPAASRATRPSEQEDVPLLSARGICKNFGAVRALTGVDLDIPAGQVTALAGDNGAGKSVLIKCFAGIHEPTTGHIDWQGRPVHIKHPADASRLGIATVYQDLALCDNLDVVQNLFLGREITRHGVVDDSAMEGAAEQTLHRLSVTTLQSLHAKVGSLSGGQRQAVAIAKSLLLEAKLVILDEPTAALGVTQTRVVLELVRRLADTGIAVLMISHNMPDVFRTADRIAVLYMGRMVAVRPTSEFDMRTLVSLMTWGRSVGSDAPDA
jgi:ABC-type sugar transport system ATPase subunit